MPIRPDSTGSFQWDPAVSGASQEYPTSAERALVRRQAPPALLQLENSGELLDSNQSQGDFHKLHQLLRGRYLLACVLAALLGAAGVYAGLRLGHKTFQSAGLVMISPIHLFNSAESAQSIEQFMLAQAAKFKTQRVLDLAMEDQDWQKPGIKLPDDFEATLLKDLEVTPQGQMLLVKFADPDASIATLAVKTSMKAFKERFDYEQKTTREITTASLRSARDTLGNKLHYVQQQIQDQSGIFGPGGVEVQRDIKLQELREVEAGLNALKLMQAQMDAMPAAKAAPTIAPSRNVPVEEIAKVDAVMQSLLYRRSQLQQQVAEISATGALAKFPKLEQSKSLLLATEDDIDKRAEEWGQTHEIAQSAVSADSANPSLQFLTREQILAKSAYLKGRQNALTTEMTNLGRQIGQIATLKIQADRIQKDLNVAEEELQQDEIEKTKWAAETNDPDRPMGAFRDTRVSLAGAGGLGGILVGFGLVLLIGLIDRRVRDPGDAAGPMVSGPILGMLPQLPEDLADPEQAAQAAFSVHEVRTLLQILGRRQNHQVFGITSPVPGSGKTSLTLALGGSFAAARFKTLMIDCDLVGGGLSTRVKAIIRRRIGMVLCRQGCISESQLREALEMSRNSGRRLGETLVEMGCLSENDLSAAIAAQEQERVGLLDALAAEPVEHCITETGIPGLWVLPQGNATARDAGTLSPDALRAVIEATRAQFDVVLVDTGPVLGSLEASVTASQVDAVVMTVARGDRAPDLQRSMINLRSLGARVAGLVFNRARKQDIERYGSSRITSTGWGKDGPADGSSPGAHGSTPLGPVAGAVSSLRPI
jgi:Mrp family chromosome partitioning ATPase